MSMFYCDYHNNIEDSDKVGYHNDEDGYQSCDAGFEALKSLDKEKEEKE